MTASASYSTTVQELYVAYFGRPADPTGLQNFSAALAAANAPTTLAGLSSEYGSNPGVTALVNTFGNSAESGRLYGTAINEIPGQAQQFVTAVFESLFDRAPLQAGLQFWSNALLTGSMTPGEAAMEIALGAATADASSFNNKIAAATAFTTDLIADNGTPIYSGPVAAAAGRSFLAGINGTTTATAIQTIATTAVDAMLGINPTPAPTPTPSIALTVAGDAIHLSGTTAASTVSLTGADLTAFPSATYGTIADLVLKSTTSITNSSGNFTLDASGNAHSTTFNFGTGVVSGSDAASSAGITYSGVTTYITSGNQDTVTLSAATQNVTASNDGQTINLGGLTYTGTLNFTAGSGGTDTINATSGGNLSGATIDGTSSSVAKIALVLSSAGSETLTTAEYNTITSTTGGSISFTGGSFGTNTIAFSNAGTITAVSSVGNYHLSAAGNTIVLNNVADNVTDDENGGNDAVFLGALTYTGTTSFGTGGSDSVHVTIGGDISGGTITSDGATVALVLSGAGSETLSTAEYNLFNATSITGGTFGGDTIIFSNGGTVTANANVGNYQLSTSGNTITLNNVGDHVTGAASGNDTVNFAALTYTGTTAFGAAGSDAIHVTVGGNISGGAITTAGATVALVLSGAGTETMNVTEYNLFNATGITGGTFGGDTIAFSNSGTVTANANVGNYNLSNSGSTTIHLNNVADHVTAGSGLSVVDTIDLAALTYTGTLNFGGNSSDTIDVTVGGNISGATMNASGAQVALSLSGSGSETLSTEEYNLFNTTGGISGGTAGSNTVVFSNAGTVADNSDIGTYDLSTAGNTITLTGTAENVNGAASGNDFVAIPNAYVGTLAFGGSGTDVVQVATGSDISSATLTSSGASLELSITGVVLNTPSGVTMSTELYNAFTAGPHAGGIVFPTGGDTQVGDYNMTFSDEGTVTDSTNIGNYYLNAAVHSTTNDIYTFNIAHNGADRITENAASTGGSTYNISVSSFTGSLTLGGSGDDTIVVSASNNTDMTYGAITSGGTTASLSVAGSGTITVNSAVQNLFHDAPNAVSASGTVTMAIGDNAYAINLSAQENALTNIGLQVDSNTVNISVGAATVNAGAPGFNQTVIENGSGGGNTFNIDNGGAGATIVGALDATHYVTINNFNTTSDNISLTLSNNAQTGGEQNISDSGNDTITVGVNSVIVEEDLGAIPGFSVFNATDLNSAKSNINKAINAAGSTSGEYTFVIDSNQGAAIYEIHVDNSGAGSIDGIQLIGVVHGVGAFNLVNHVG